VAEPKCDEYDYVIVGSGAGGGTLAARLAEKMEGFTICLLEAGGDPLWGHTEETIAEDYEVPAFHPFASENPAMSWEFYVRHYGDDKQQSRDPKAVEGKGIYYPRASALGGCTAHNAMIFVYPHDSDWETIYQITRDESWRPAEMQKYAKRIEKCRHRPSQWLLRWFGLDFSGHGWTGWLTTEKAIPRRSIFDHRLVRLVLGTITAEIWRRPGKLASLFNLLRYKFDPNDRGWLKRRLAGPVYTPLSTVLHRRAAVRERVLSVAERYPERLHIFYNALAAKVLFDDVEGSSDALRATAVEYFEGENLYKADPRSGGDIGTRKIVRARREVILAGGAFNTPQLLMLSGIGPECELAAHGIEVKVPLCGVGRNLQDRYEVSVVHRATSPWYSLRGARFEKGDPLYRQWSHGGNGFYGSNGVAVSFSMRSSEDRYDPDLFCIGLLGRFTGYYPSYSREIPKHLDTISFTLLKAHTENRSGRVTLRSTDPRDPPRIDFHYFDECYDKYAKPEQRTGDLEDVVAGIGVVRGIADKLVAQGLLLEEELPGRHVESKAELAQFVRDNAWGHHACGTCAIGPRETDGVLTKDFKVHGTRNVRVVDAAVFPVIPGFFIASAIFMIAEKAADVVLREAGILDD
jgi:choline dehydrogenase